MARGESEAGPDTARYSAFISYSHHDRVEATRLQRRIEGYRLPRHLRRRGTPARLRPVFRDRDELTAAPDLSEAVRAALRDSAALIVVCTPAAACSEWVNREVTYFEETHPDQPVLAALFAGTSMDAFPPALLAGPTGALAHPLAADFRRDGDGRRLALLKLIAPLAGVRLDELVQRDAQRRIRQIGGLALGAVALVVAAATLILIAMHARAAAEREQARGADAMQFQLTDLRRKLAAAGRLDLLAAVNQGVDRYYRGQDPRTLSVPALLQRAALLQADGKDDEQRGDYPAAHRKMIEAWRLTAPLLAAYPRDAKIIYAHAQSEYYMGFVDWRLGDATNAKARFERYAALANRLIATDPRNPDWRHERGFAASGLGAIALRQAVDPTSARRYFAAAQKDFMAVARAKPDDPDIQSDIADGEAWLADVERVAGDLPRALAHRERQHAIVAAQVAHSPRDAHLRVNLVASELGRARVEAAQGRFAVAIDGFDGAHRMAEELAAADPDNKSVARQKRAIELFKAQTWLFMPAAGRPPLPQIAATLGECDPEWRKPRNDELATLCTLDAAELSVQRGDPDRARAILQGLSRRPFVRATRLTERWRLNLPSMMERVAAELRTPGGMARGGVKQGGAR